MGGLRGSWLALRAFGGVDKARNVLKESKSRSSRQQADLDRNEMPLLDKCPGNMDRSVYCRTH